VKAKIKSKLAGSQTVSGALDEWFGANRVKYGSLQVAYVDRAGSFGTAYLGHFPLEGTLATEQAVRYLQIIDAFGTRGKLKCITTDNAPVCSCMVRHMGLTPIGCSAHALNLMLRDLIGVEQAHLQALLQLTGRTRHTDGFQKLCIKAGKSKTALTTFTTTRFYSLHKLMVNVIDLENEVEAFVADLIRKKSKARSSDWKRKMCDELDRVEADPAVTLEETLEPSVAKMKEYVGHVPSLDKVKRGIEVCQQLVVIVGQFAQQTHIIERDGFLTLGDVVPGLYCIEMEIAESLTASEDVKQAWTKAMTEHWRKLVSMQQEQLMNIAFLLVPDGNHELVLGDRLDDTMDKLRDMVKAVKASRGAVRAEGAISMSDSPSYKPRRLRS
jgi:hypothetical protein